MKANPVGWFEIYVQDAAKARAFYEKVLGTQLAALPGTDIEMWAFPMAQGASGAAGALVKMDGFPSGGNSTLVYFACDDCATEEARVVANGGRVEKPKFSIGEYGFITLAIDTEGNMFGLHSMK
ncbi:VOC family protein [Hydrogenophaga sp. BPS33]|uniref:VOC family protein n=1 Tax=Hydrogenophaga sp. BPS33 TaxID=2651974 RepID=UPI00131FA63C|nr:VOC family protein [Hydrogenophaga sp. BPS33]QHE87258.1 VOC family protein [Hydrogenophaga sp. BPS33]